VYLIEELEEYKDVASVTDNKFQNAFLITMVVSATNLHAIVTSFSRSLNFLLRFSSTFSAVSAASPARLASDQTLARKNTTMTSLLGAAEELS